MRGRILIVGGGIVGLTAASALRQRDVDVDLVEISKEWTQQVGVGLTIVPNALRALSTIGVAKKCIETGIPSYGSAVFNADGSPGEGSPTQPEGSRRGNVEGAAFPGVGIGRAVFHRILADAALAKGTHVRFGLTVASIEDAPDRVHVRFTDGSEGDYDLVIGADGIYSATRKRLFPGVDPVRTGQAVWRAAVPRPEAVRRTHQYFNGRHGLVGLCPISEDLAYVYIIEASNGDEAFDRTRLHEILRERLEGYGGYIPDVAASLQSPETVNYRQIERMLIPSPWHRGRCVIMGDAAHAGPPVLAQGAAMGIEDAVIFAEEFERADDFRSALEAFMRRRFERAKLVIDASVALCQWEVNPDAVADMPQILKRVSEELARPM